MDNTDSRKPDFNELALKTFEDFVINSSDRIADFSKSMITLVSGLFVVYFAMLKFLGVEEISKMHFQASDGLFIPPILFVSSIVFFVIGYLPNVFSALLFGYARIDLLNFSHSVNKLRSRILIARIIPSGIATILFIAGLFITMNVFMGRIMN